MKGIGQMNMDHTLCQSKDERLAGKSWFWDGDGEILITVCQVTIKTQDSLSLKGVDFIFMISRLYKTYFHRILTLNCPDNPFNVHSKLHKPPTKQWFPSARQNSVCIAWLSGANLCVMREESSSCQVGAVSSGSSPSLQHPAYIESFQ